MSKITSIILLAFGLASGVALAVSDVVTAEFQHNSKHSSSIVKSGTLKAEIQWGADATDALFKYDFNVDLKMFGRVHQSDQSIVDGDLLSGALIAQIREEKVVNHQDVRIEYEGKHDVTTVDGVTYEGCDRLKLTNFNKRLNLEKLFEGQFGVYNPVFAPRIEKITVYYHPDVPKMSVARIIVQAKESIVSIKVAADFVH